MFSQDLGGELTYDVALHPGLDLDGGTDIRGLTWRLLAVLLLDLPAGRVLGPWLLDRVAPIMLALGLIGLIIWWCSR